MELQMRLREGHEGADLGTEERCARILWMLHA